MYNIACILMASGLSKRMERNKLLLSFNGKKLFTYCVDALAKSDIKQKIVVSSYDEILNYANNLSDVITLKNSDNHLGQSRSIVLGVSNSKACDGYMFLPCDMPFITADIINKISEFFYEDISCITVPRVNKKNSMPTIFPHFFKNDLLSIKGDVGGKNIIISNPDMIRYIDIKNPILLQDIDTEEDLKYIKNLANPPA